MSDFERSLSRGRDAFQSTGRGGAGNFRSPSREPPRGPGPEDYSDTRGRDPIPSRNPDEITSLGRGGAGNIRSPSRGRGEDSRETSLVRSEQRGRGYDRELIDTIDGAHDTGVRSHGRGGAGNMSPSPPKSKSRSRSREPIHATGRGGFGNIVVSGPSEKVIEELDESERAAHYQTPGLHSSGRGGVANLKPGQVPHPEGVGNPHGAYHPRSSHEHDTESHGRGGMGNISRDHSREPGLRNTHNAPSGLHA